MSKNTVQILERAREKVKQSWTQGAGARDKFGSAIDPDNPHAVSWCLAGACYASCIEVEKEQAFVWDVIEAVERYIWESEINRTLAPMTGIRPRTAVHFNDSKDITQEDIVKLLTRVIEQYKADVPV